MNKFLGYRCLKCKTEYPFTQNLYTCPKDGSNLEIIIDTATIRRKYEISDIVSRNEESLWRYLPLLPVKDPGGEGTPLHMTGWTPLYSPPALRQALGLKSLWIKDEGRNPTGSFKDRASAIVIARGIEIKAEVLVTASTGNAGAALAGLSAAVAQKAVIFAPKTAPPAKIAQLLIYGSQVILVNGNYDSAFDLSVEAANQFGWYSRNTGYNPFTAEGKKTAAFEIWEQVILKENTSHKPLIVFVSVGDGNIISGIHKGFQDLLALGWLEQMPRLFGVQAEGSSAIANAYFNHSDVIVPVKADTIADSISVDLPRDGDRALHAVIDSKGTFLKVSDQMILDAIVSLENAGIFSEPAGAAAYAGLTQAIEQGKVNADDPVVVINTGNGLKDVRAAMKAVAPAPVIEPTMLSLRELLNK